MHIVESDKQKEIAAADSEIDILTHQNFPTPLTEKPRTDTILFAEARRTIIKTTGQ
jgi:hypothetical protein